jgi:hypothetical protein
MKHTVGWICVIVVTCLGTSARAQEDEAALIEAGKAAMKSLKPLAPGTKHAAYFALKRGPDEAVGYAFATLDAAGSKEKPVYAYATETGVTFPTGAWMLVVVTAKLRPDFEPTEVEVKRTIVREDGQPQHDVQRATVGPDKIALFAEAGEQRTEKEVPRPDRPFIYGIETLVQRVDFEKHQHFVVREFDAYSGGARSLDFKRAVWSDGTPTVVTRTSGGQGSYQFWYDDGGKLHRWGEPSLPVFFVRATKERAEQLQAKFKKASTAKDEQPPKQTGG